MEKIKFIRTLESIWVRIILLLFTDPMILLSAIIDLLPGASRVSLNVARVGVYPLKWVSDETLYTLFKGMVSRERINELLEGNF